MGNECNKLLDETQVNNLKSLFKEKFKDLISSYLKDVESKEKELSLQIENKELDKAMKIAHALRGSSLNIGALGVAHACEKIEIAAKTGDYHTTLEEFQSLQKIYPSVKEKYLQISA